jgi:hypothetical protein
MSTGADTHPLPAHLLCAALVAVALFFLASCKDNPIKPVINSAPVITQEISPLKGTSPLEERIKVGATDPDGIGDIVSYETVVRNNFNSDSLVLTKNPTDTTLTFIAPSGIEKAVYNIKSTAVDKKGAKDSKETNVEVYQPITYIYQKATLQDSVDIKYEATIKNLNEPRLDVSKNGSVILSRTIKDSSYSEILSYSNNTGITQGNYGFALKGKIPAGKDTSNTTSITVPNYSPNVNLSGLKEDMDEGGEIILDLKSRIENSDPNPENNPVEIGCVFSLDDKTEASFSGYNVKIKSLEDKVGDYQVRVDVGNDKAGESSAVVKNKIYDLLDIRNGVLEDNEQHSRQSGTIMVFDGKVIDQVTGKLRRLEEIKVGPSGEFNKRINFRVSDLVNYVLIQARSIENGRDTTSFIKSTKLSREDVNGLVMRVVPYAGLAEHGITPEDFSRHIREVLTADGTNGKGTVDALTLNPIIYKWKEIPDFIISTTPNDSTVHAFFNRTTEDNTKSRILDPNDIGAWFNGRVTDLNKIQIVKNYDVSQPGQEGKLVIYPWNNISQGFFLDFNKDGYIDFGQTKNSVNTNGEIISAAAECHEGGHAAGMGTNGSGAHALTLTQDKTIMVPFLININYYTPRFADKKTAKAINEDSYIHGQGRNPDGLLRVNDIEEFKWADQ